jgi:eukaryotic-like serine/threonine-protein kinase
MFPTEPVPDRIGSYQVLRRIGGTGRADVYVGRMDGPLGFQRTVQLKLVPFSIEDDARLAEELEREASICARLNHPGVLRMFDFFEHERRLVLVLDHVDGASLERLHSHLLRRKQKLGDKAIFYMGLQLAAALGHAHETTDDEGNLTPVIHRNLHPQNVMISWEGQVRLTGFGLGKILGRTPDTIVGNIKGTPGYMAPEQARGERVTTRADVYGLAVLLWSLLAGREPPVNEERPASLIKLRADIPREIAAALDAALEPNPDKRKITCQELEQWLSKVVKPEPARTELREKILMLRSTRSPVGETQDVARAPRAGKQQRRRLHLRGVKASMRPAGPGPLSQPPPPSSRPAIRRSSAAPGPRSEEPSSSRSPSSSAAAHSSRAPSSARTLPNFRLPPPPAFEPPPPPPSTAPVAARNTDRLPPPPSSSGPAPPVVDPAPPPLEPLESRSDNGHVLPLDLGGPDDAAQETGGVRPRARRPPPRPLTAPESIGVAALTAALVVGLGIVILERDSLLGDEQAAEDGPASAANAVPGPAATEPTAPETHAASVAPPAVPSTPAQSAAPAPAEPPAEPLAEPPPLDGTSLPGGHGYLTVTSRVEADVYLHGKRVGVSNEPLVVLCGRWFLRLATPNPGRFPSWIGPGETVYVGCQTDTTMEMDPGPPPGRD